MGWGVRNYTIKKKGVLNAANSSTNAPHVAQRAPFGDNVRNHPSIIIEPISLNNLLPYNAMVMTANANSSLSFFSWLLKNFS